MMTGNIFVVNKLCFIFGRMQHGNTDATHGNVLRINFSIYNNFTLNINKNNYNLLNIIIDF